MVAGRGRGIIDRDRLRDGGAAAVVVGSGQLDAVAALG